jgi:hypothetical protein
MGRRRPQCEICFRRFSRPDRLVAHKHFAHNPNKPKPEDYECLTCHKKFGFKNNLVQHELLVHLKQYPYHCTHCEQGFPRKERLFAHILRCTGAPAPENLPMPTRRTRRTDNNNDHDDDDDESDERDLTSSANEFNDLKDGDAADETESSASSSLEDHLRELLRARNDRWIEMMW